MASEAAVRAVLDEVLGEYDDRLSAGAYEEIVSRLATPQAPAAAPAVDGARIDELQQLARRAFHVAASMPASSEAGLRRVAKATSLADDLRAFADRESARRTTPAAAPAVDGEALARVFCKHYGLDPDSPVDAGGIGVMIPRWQAWEADARRALTTPAASGGEAVARALYAAHRKQYDPAKISVPAWDDLPQHARDHWLEISKAAPQQVAQVPRGMLCRECGEPTMHAGPLCFACTKVAAPSAEGESK